MGNNQRCWVEGGREEGEEGVKKERENEASSHTVFWGLDTPALALIIGLLRSCQIGWLLVAAHLGRTLAGLYILSCLYGGGLVGRHTVGAAIAHLQFSSAQFVYFISHKTLQMLCYLLLSLSILL